MTSLLPSWLVLSPYCCPTTHHGPAPRPPSDPSMRQLWWRKTLFAKFLEDEIFDFSEINLLVDLYALMRDLASSN